MTRASVRRRGARARARARAAGEHGLIAFTGPPTERQDGGACAPLRRARRGATGARAAPRSSRPRATTARARSPRASRAARRGVAVRGATLDALAFELLRAHPLAAGLALDLELLDPLDAEEIFERAAAPLFSAEWSDWLGADVDPEIAGLRAPGRFAARGAAADPQAARCRHRRRRFPGDRAARRDDVLRQPAEPCRSRRCSSRRRTNTAVRCAVDADGARTAAPARARPGEDRRAALPRLCRRARAARLPHRERRARRGDAAAREAARRSRARCAALARRVRRRRARSARRRRCAFCARCSATRSTASRSPATSMPRRRRSPARGPNAIFGRAATTVALAARTLPAAIAAVMRASIDADPTRRDPARRRGRVLRATRPRRRSGRGRRPHRRRASRAGTPPARIAVAAPFAARCSRRTRTRWSARDVPVARTAIRRCSSAPTCSTRSALLWTAVDPFRHAWTAARAADRRCCGSPMRRSRSSAASPPIPQPALFALPDDEPTATAAGTASATCGLGTNVLRGERDADLERARARTPDRVSRAARTLDRVAAHATASPPRARAIVEDGGLLLRARRRNAGARAAARDAGRARARTDRARTPRAIRSPTSPTRCAYCRAPRRGRTRPD